MDKPKVPPGWIYATVGDVVTSDGIFTDGDWVETKDQDPNGDVRLIQLADIGDGSFLDKSSRFLTGVKAHELNCTFLAKGDLLVARMPDPLGRCCIFPLDGVERYVTVVDVCAVRFGTSSIASKYMMYAINSPRMRTAIEALKSGSTRKRISRGNLARVEITLAPQNEQHRIVAKIEELFSELDKGIESLKAARAKLNVYRQAVLKHAFEGKLTAQWREENKDKLEKPEQLLARIKQEREARYGWQLKEWKAAVKTWDAEGRPGKKPSKPKKLAQSPPRAAEDVLALPKLPEDWSWFSLSAVAGNIQIGPFGSLLHKADYLVGGTPLVNPSHIRSQRIEADRTLTVSTDKLRQLGKYVMHENDIVIGRRGEMGRCAVVTAEEAGWLCGTGSLFVRLLSSMNPHFYSWVLGSQRVKDFLAASSVGTTMQNLNEDILHRVPVPVCSRHEQDEVFREIERQYSTLDHIEAEIDSEITKSAILHQSVLKKAFAGQLVAQDPNDEPASVLLDRIMAEREKAMKNNHSKKTKKRKTTA